jgi:sirohydrochlorin cobaltochelatase
VAEEHTPDADEVPALLVIAHGTRDPRGKAEMAELLALMRRAHAVPVAHAWLEDFAEPGVAEAVEELAAAGVRRIASVPFLNFGAYHAKTDVPNELAMARAAHPAIEFRHGRVLGLHPALFELARRRVAAAGGVPGDDAARGEEVLVVAASGSSDPDANSDVAKAARFLAEQTGHRWVEHAFAGVTWPAIGDVLRRAARCGARRAVVFNWSLLAGLLEQRLRDAAADVTADTGLEVLDAGRFGPDARVAGAVLDRWREAVEGDVRMNCDLCAYRVPLRGIEGQVGAPSGGGTGERVPPAS